MDVVYVRWHAAGPQEVVERAAKRTWKIRRDEIHGDKSDGMEHEIVDTLAAWEHFCVNLAFCLRIRMANHGPSGKA